MGKLSLVRSFIGIALSCGLVVSTGCRPSGEEIHLASERPRATDAEVDADPWRLLPPGAVAWMRADAKLWQSEFGPDVAQLLQDKLPFAKDAGIDPQRDIELIIGGIYATVATDVVAVCQGSFDAEKTHAAVLAHPESAMGKKIISATFAGQKIYVVEQAAMAVLTDRTMVFGTQLGVRRVLELVEEGRMDRSLPQWFDGLLSQDGANFQIGVDLDAQAVPAVLRTKLSFLNHLRAARLLGNYQAPGLNLAGALTFDTPTAAEEAAVELNQASSAMEKYEVLMVALQMPRPIRRIEAASTGKDSQVVMELDGKAVGALLTRGGAVFDDLFTPEE